MFLRVLCLSAFFPLFPSGSIQRAPHITFEGYAFVLDSDFKTIVLADLYRISIKHERHKASDHSYNRLFQLFAVLLF